MVLQDILALSDIFPINRVFVVFSAKNFFKFTLILVFITFFAIFLLYLSLRDELPNIDSLKDVQWQTPMQIYSSDGLLISQFGEKKRKPLTFDEIPQQLINALLATEDDRFYFHFGVDPIGMGRAIFGKLTGNDKGGASTITMQVARNFFLTREITYTRKIREIFISFHIESLLTKDEILALYMNKISLGHRSFGFGAAAQVYYGKETKELTLAQIAVLAGLPKAPSTLNPISRPDRALKRRAVVLQRMYVAGYIKIELVEGETNFSNNYGGFSSLFRNTGNNNWVDISNEAGIWRQHNTFLGVFADLDNDRNSDLIIAQDTGKVETYRGDGKANFTPIQVERSEIT